MLVSSLKKMEQIVARNKLLYWDGWDVIFSKPHPGAWARKNGAFVNGAWHSQDRFVCGEKGWQIPDKLVR